MATPAAVIASLAIATVASATLLLTVGRLHAARSELRYSQVRYALAGAQESAVVTLQSASSQRLVWKIESPAGSIEMLAEPEVLKVSPASAAEKGLTDDLLQSLGAAEPDAVRRAFAALSSRSRHPVDDIIALEPQEVWKSCIRSVVSPWGQAPTMGLGPAQAPGPQAGISRVGETWRVVSNLAGLTEDRTVVLTGDLRRPMVTLDRRPVIHAKGAPACDSLFATRPA